MITIIIIKRWSVCYAIEKKFANQLAKRIKDIGYQYRTREESRFNGRLIMVRFEDTEHYQPML